MRASSPGRLRYVFGQREGLVVLQHDQNVGPSNVAPRQISTGRDGIFLGRSGVVPPVEAAGRRLPGNTEAAGQHVEFAVLPGAVVEGGATFGLPINGGGGGADGLGGGDFGLWWPLRTMAASCAQSLARGLPLGAVRQPPAMGSSDRGRASTRRTGIDTKNDEGRPGGLQSHRRLCESGSFFFSGETRTMIVPAAYRNTTPFRLGEVLVTEPPTDGRGVPPRTPSPGAPPAYLS